MMELYHGKTVWESECAEPNVLPVTFKNGNPFGMNSPPDEWVDILNRCLMTESNQRPSAKECFNMFQSYVDSHSPRFVTYEIFYGYID